MATVQEWKVLVAELLLLTEEQKAEKNFQCLTKEDIRNNLLLALTSGFLIPINQVDR